MRKKKKALKAAFPHTIPVLLGYLFIGIAFGILLRDKGLGAGWAALMSTLIYAGSMQFVALNFFAGGWSLASIALMTLMVNLRHMFYGLSMLDAFKSMGRKKPYMIFSLTDETFSLLCSAQPPEGVDKDSFLFCMALLDHVYWIAGSVLGSLIGSLIPFDSTGIDFAMTALFVVIFVEQWQAMRNHLPALSGVGAALLCLSLFGPNRFILPTLVLIAGLLALFRKSMAQEADAS